KRGACQPSTTIRIRKAPLPTTTPRSTLSASPTPPRCPLPLPPPPQRKAETYNSYKQSISYHSRRHPRNLGLSALALDPPPSRATRTLREGGGCGGGRAGGRERRQQRSRSPQRDPHRRRRQPEGRSRLGGWRARSVVRPPQGHLGTGSG